jgi:hypothetical protein
MLFQFDGQERGQTSFHCEIQFDIDFSFIKFARLYQLTQSNRMISPIDNNRKYSRFQSFVDKQ